MNGWNGLSGRFIKFLDGLDRLDEMGRTVVKLEKNEIKSSSTLTPNPSILPQTRLTLLNQPKPPNPPPDTPPWVASSVI